MSEGEDGKESRSSGSEDSPDRDSDDYFGSPDEVRLVSSNGESPHKIADIPNDQGNSLCRALYLYRLLQRAGVVRKKRMTRDSMTRPPKGSATSPSGAL